VAPSSAKIGSFSETFWQCFFNEMNRPVIIQQVVGNLYLVQISSPATGLLPKDGAQYFDMTDFVLLCAFKIKYYIKTSCFSFISFTVLFLHTSFRRFFVSLHAL
jgi:hypothetical protein